MATAATKAPTNVYEACHTAVSELHGAPLGDIVDAVCIQLEWSEFKTHEDAIWSIVSDLV